MKTDQLAAHFEDESVIQKFTKVLGYPGAGYVQSILKYCETDPEKKLPKADPTSVETSFLLAAELRLNFSRSVRECYVSAQKDGRQMLATFNVTSRGLIQLCLRSDKYVTLNVEKVVEGELVSQDRMTGEKVFSWIEDNDKRNEMKVVGYVSFFRCVTDKPGIFFEKSTYMSILELEAHGQKYSTNYAEKWGGRDSDKFPAMAQKTVLKLPLDKYGQKTAELAKALQYDQSRITEDGQPDYIDNKKRPATISTEEMHGTLSLLFLELEKQIPSNVYKRWEMIINEKETDNYDTLHRELLIIKNK